MNSNSDTYRYLFGPVVSRRYGLSLGVDMVLPKTCSFNCLFCQIGETAQTTVTPENNPPIDDIIAELSSWINKDGECDIITLAGSGEPTLHREFGRILSYIKEQTPYPSLLLSNGSLFFLKDIREQAMNADIVKLSLHAWDQHSFEKITRADSSLVFDKIIVGYQKFRNAYKGRIDLEVFVLPGINDTPAQMKRIAKLAKTFSPDSIFLNTAVRPPADSSVKEASPEKMAEFSALFGEAATQPTSRPKTGKRPYSDESIIKLTSRHPTSVNQLVKQFDISHDELIEHLRRLETGNLISLQTKDLKTFVIKPT